MVSLRRPGLDQSRPGPAPSVGIRLMVLSTMATQTSSLIAMRGADPGKTRGPRPGAVVEVALTIEHPVVRLCLPARQDHVQRECRRRACMVEFHASDWVSPLHCT